MFVFSFKASSVKIMCLLCVCLIIGAAVIALMPRAGYAVNVNKLQVQDTLEKISVKDNKGRLKYFDVLGFTVEEKPCIQKEETVPKVFDAAMEEYNGIQKMQGFDLSKFKGKKVKSYTYKVTGLPDGTKFGDNELLATLVVYKNKVVAADLCCENTSQAGCLVKPV